jgi:hypothetical protein
MDSEKNRAFVESLVGCRCIYKAKVIIFLGEVLEARADDWGIKFKFRVLENYGYHLEVQSEYEADAAWSIVGVRESDIGASYAGWVVFLEAEWVKRIAQYAGKAERATDIIDYLGRGLFLDGRQKEAE